VTKRDLFHVFHKHGKLAQISIKQAYGFVQFLEAASCYEALNAEQGEIIRGRKIRQLPAFAFLETRTDQSQISKSLSLRRTLATLQRRIVDPSLGDVLVHQKGGEAPAQAAIDLIAPAIRRGFLSAIIETSHQDVGTSTGLFGPRHLVATVPETTIEYATGAQLFKATGMGSL